MPPRTHFLRPITVLAGAICAVALMGGSLSVLADRTAAAATDVIPAGISPGAGILSLSDADLATTLSGIVASGATWLRVDVDWPTVEASQGDFHWSVPDRVIDAAVADGLKVDALVTYTPSWAADPATGFPDPNDFAQFAAAALEHYAPIGVHTWEIWNEPNLAQNWGTTVSPSAYAALLERAYSAIKAVDPSAFVISGGLSPACDAVAGSTTCGAPVGSQLSPATFLTQMYAAGAEGYFDAVGMHPYSFPAMPMDPTTASWNPFYNLPTIYGIMAANGDGGKQVWITEYGAPTGTDTVDGAVSEATQAAMITAAFAQIQQWSWAGPLFYYNWQDGTDPTTISDNFGLVTSTFAPTPALAAFTAAITLPAPSATTSTSTDTGSTDVAPTTTTTTTTTDPDDSTTSTSTPVTTTISDPTTSDPAAPPADDSTTSTTAPTSTTTSIDPSVTLTMNPAPPTSTDDTTTVATPPTETTPDRAWSGQSRNYNYPWWCFFHFMC